MSDTASFSQEMLRYFNAIDGAYTTFTQAELEKGTFNVKKPMRNVLIKHLGEENIPRANKHMKQTIQFKIVNVNSISTGKIDDIECKFSKPYKDEMTIYLKKDLIREYGVGSGDYWCVFFTENDSNPVIGFALSRDWKRLFAPKNTTISPWDNNEYYNSMEKEIVDLLRKSNQPLGASEISEQLDRDKNKISKTLKSMVSRGILTNVFYDKLSVYYLSEKPLLNEEYKKAPITDFKYINNEDDLRAYLTSSKRINNENSVCQYTNVSAACKIITSGYWYLGNPRNMNDAVEYHQFNESFWNSVFFSSFMIEKAESIGMWSMYAQPWEDGVMISIPGNCFKQWARDLKDVYYANPMTKEPDLSRSLERERFNAYTGRVAYIDDSKESYQISCGTSVNGVLKDVYRTGSLIGLVKDSAWSYEQEVRLRVDLDPSIIDCQAISIKIPEYVLESLTITIGPRCSNVSRLSIEELNLKKGCIRESKFYEKLNWVPCDSCKKNK